MEAINKQKFLAELGRLLTFMYEEDRQTALAMYSKMFDDAAEEQSLLQFFVSPTRQAVVLARAYDAQESKLQVHSQSREGNYDYNGQVPQFVTAIDDLRQKAQALGLFAQAEAVQTPDKNQFSLFDDTSESSSYFQSEAQTVGTENSQGSGDVEEVADAIDAFLADFSISDLIQGQSSSKPAEDDSDLVLPTRIPVKRAIDEAPLELYHNGEEETGEDEVQEEAVAQEEAVDEPAQSGEYAPELIEAKEKESVKVSVKELRKHSKADAADEVNSIAAADAVTVKPVVKSAGGSKKNDGLDIDLSDLDQVATVRRANVPLLILYILLAIIPTLLGIVILLIPTVLCLAIAVALVSGGVLVLTAAFSGFAIFADLMVVLGLAIILLALGLLFTWMFIWFIGGAIVGFVRGICHLGGKLCFKEVAAQ